MIPSNKRYELCSCGCLGERATARNLRSEEAIASFVICKKCFEKEKQASEEYFADYAAGKIDIHGNVI